MRITCLIDSLGSGGAQRQMAMLATEFARAGHEVRVLAYHDEAFFAPMLAESGVGMTCLCDGKFFPKLSRIRNVRRELRLGGQDAVLSFLQTPNILAEVASLPRRNWRLVVSERNADKENIASHRGKLIRQFHRAADVVVTNADATRDMLERTHRFLRGRIWTIYNAIDLQRFSPAEKLKNVSGRRFLVIVPASVHPKKNVRGVITAVALMSPEERSRLEIRWYGESRTMPLMRQEYEGAVAEVSRLGLGECIRLLPPTSRIEEQLATADAVALFSHREGLPNAIAEGMACGKPVIMSRVADAERLLRDGEGGLLCDPRDPSSIAEALRGMLGLSSETRSEMGRANRLYAERTFDPRNNAAAYLELLSGSLSTRGEVP